MDGLRERLILFCFVVTTACGGAAQPSQSPAAAAAAPSAREPGVQSTPPVEQSPPSAKAEEPPAGPRLTLLDPGQAPRQKLRYAFTMKPEIMVLDMSMKLSIQAGDRQSPETVLPTTRMFMKIVPKSVSPEGDLSYEGTVARNEVLSDGALPPPIRQKMQETMKSMNGMTVASTVSSRGVVRDATVQIPRDAAPEIRQALESMRDAMRTMCTPLPEEDVGVGAVWRVDQDMQMAFRFAQTTNVTLKKLERNHIVLEAAITQSASDQPMTSNELPPGATIRLERMSGVGRGTIDVRLDHVTPVSTMTADNDSSMVVTAEGASMTTGTRMHLVVKVKPGN